MTQRQYDNATPCEVCGCVAEPGKDLCASCRRRVENEEAADIAREDNAARIPAEDVELWQ